MENNYDLLVVGGGVNGAGIARDAAGRGLSVLLVEKDDLACATSSSSSKLIHGGLRYLELYEFRLVAEALAERETLLRVAAHLVWPARFVIPHVPELRPRWMIRAGLFLYDHLSRRASLPGSKAVRLDVPPYSSGLQPQLKHGFAYSDCRVDDARLVIANAMDARERGVRVLTRTGCLSAARANGRWVANLSNGERANARAVVNAAGPWVKSVLNERMAQASGDAVRLVKGSHIVLPKLYVGEHAFILQNDDRRVIFMIPYGELHTLVGTTDVPVHDADARPEVSAEEVAYLCRAVNRYLARPARPDDIVWKYAGVRPLYDDGTTDPSAVTMRRAQRRCYRCSAARSPPIAGWRSRRWTGWRVTFPDSSRRGPTVLRFRAAILAAHRASRHAMRSLQATRISPSPRCGEFSAATGRMRKRWSATATWERISAPGSANASSAISSPRNGRRPPKTYCGGVPRPAC